MRALITGASGGIGLELAKIFAAHGHDLILVARSRNRLQDLAAELRPAGVAVEVVARDLAAPYAADGVIASIRGLDVDVLVNNAGFGQFGLFAETDPREEVDMLQVNIVVPTRLTKLLLPQMIARRRGRILNVASAAAFQPGPLMAVYFATKAYLLHWSEALAEEVAAQGVTVTALCPGPTRTGFEHRAAMSRSRLFTGGKVADARSVAQAGFDGLMNGKRIVVPTACNRLLAFGTRFAPRSLITKLARRVNEEG